MRLFIICSIECKTQPLQHTTWCAVVAAVVRLFVSRLRQTELAAGLSRARELRGATDDDDDDDGSLLKPEISDGRKRERTEPNRTELNGRSEFDLSGTRNIVITPPVAARRAIILMVASFS